MQAGLRLATKVIAVSQGYAWEITTDMGGWGLAPLLREFTSRATTPAPAFQNRMAIRIWCTWPTTGTPRCCPFFCRRFTKTTANFRTRAPCL